MLENAILYRIDAAWLADIEVASKGFERLLYEPIWPTQDQAIGWTQPRGEENGAMIESVGGQWIIKFAADKKTVPADVRRFPSITLRQPTQGGIVYALFHEITDAFAGVMPMRMETEDSPKWVHQLLRDAAKPAAK